MQLPGLNLSHQSLGLAIIRSFKDANLAWTHDNY